MAFVEDKIEERKKEFKCGVNGKPCWETLEGVFYGMVVTTNYDELRKKLVATFERCISKKIDLKENNGCNNRNHALL